MTGPHLYQPGTQWSDLGLPSRGMDGCPAGTGEDAEGSW